MRGILHGRFIHVDAVLLRVVLVLYALFYGDR